MLYELKQIRLSFYKVSLGFLYILCPGDLSNAKLNKIGCRKPFRKMPSMQSHSKCILSIPVISIDFSLLCDPGISSTKPSTSPNGSEWDYVKPNFVKEKDFEVNLIVLLVVKFELV